MGKGNTVPRISTVVDQKVRSGQSLVANRGGREGGEGALERWPNEASQLIESVRASLQFANDQRVVDADWLSRVAATTAGNLPSLLGRFGAFSAVLLSLVSSHHMVERVPFWFLVCAAQRWKGGETMNALWLGRGRLAGYM